MQLNKILFPTDFSHTGDAALALDAKTGNSVPGATVIPLPVVTVPSCCEIKRGWIGLACLFD